MYGSIGKVCLLLLISLGSAVFMSLVPVLIRRYYFAKYFRKKEDRERLAPEAILEYKVRRAGVFFGFFSVCNLIFKCIVFPFGLYRINILVLCDYLSYALFYVNRLVLCVHVRRVLSLEKKKNEERKREFLIVYAPTTS